MQKKPNGLGRGLGALLNPDLMKAPTPPPQTKQSTFQTPQLNTQPQDAISADQAVSPHQIPPTAPHGALSTSPSPTLKNLKNTNFTALQETEKTQNEQRVLNLSTSQLKPLVDQPRTEFYSSTLDELAVSIKSYGILQPIVVSHTDIPEQYTIIAGERRWRAAQLAGLETIPCVLRQPSEHSSLELALIENIQREELSPLDEARAFSKLLDEHAYTQDTLASKVGKDRATISNSLRLLSLPPEILTDLQAKSITAGHARALCSLDEKKMQLKVRDMIVSKKLSVRQTEDIVKELKRDRDSNDTHGSPQLSPDLRHLCDQFKGHLGTKVRITGSADRGRIEISYYTFEDLERISDLMLSPGLNPRRPRA